MALDFIIKDTEPTILLSKQILEPEMKISSSYFFCGGGGGGYPPDKDVGTETAPKPIFF